MTQANPYGAPLSTADQLEYLSPIPTFYLIVTLCMITSSESVSVLQSRVFQLFGHEVLC